VEVIFTARIPRPVMYTPFQVGKDWGAPYASYIAPLPPKDEEAVYDLLRYNFSAIYRQLATFIAQIYKPRV